MTTLITGANSFIGLPLVRFFLNEGHNVVAVIRPNKHSHNIFPKNEHLQILELSMDSYADMSKYIPKADNIIHLAWSGARGEERQNKETQNKNYMYSIDLAKESLKMNISSFIGVGSQAEYTPTNRIITETSDTNPLTAYGKAKLATYNNLSDIFKNTNIKFSWIRIFSLFGKGDYENSVIEYTINQLIKNEDVLLGPCTHMWNYLYIDDAITGIYSVLEKGEFGIYNLANPYSLPLKEYILKINDIIKSKSKLVFGHYTYNNGQIYDINPNVDKILADTLWKPKTSFVDGIDKIYKEKLHE